mmetsp:Transcript_3895/g.16167  ORF Transcript_3895/g.16167 Transcript_3895/m.16167 type:complete len:218 (+) Transcript_3895:297-950(+)
MLVATPKSRSTSSGPGMSLRGGASPGRSWWLSTRPPMITYASPIVSTFHRCARSTSASNRLYSAFRIAITWCGFRDEDRAVKPTRSAQSMTTSLGWISNGTGSLRRSFSFTWVGRSCSSTPSACVLARRDASRCRSAWRSCDSCPAASNTAKKRGTKSIRTVAASSAGRQAVGSRRPKMARATSTESAPPRESVAMAPELKGRSGSANMNTRGTGTE